MFDQAPELYDLFYEWKDYRSEADRIRAIAHDRHPGARTLLDVACGTGEHLAYLREWFDVAGLDLDGGLLSIAERKLPGVPLHRADMRDFDLAQTFDVVTCLFSSIGYMQTDADLDTAVGTMARHLSASGVLIIEPWLGPDTFDPQHVSRTLVVQRPELEAVRMNGSRVEGGRSILDLHYLIATPGRVEHRVETHALGLFEGDAYQKALENADLAVEHDPDGLMGRGLWIGRRVPAARG